jgi:hypothetical protein
MHKLSESKCCWLCSHGVFNRQSGASGSRYRGYCVESMREYKWPIAWYPPVKFYQDASDGIFETDYEEWLLTHAHEYYGEAVIVEIATNSGLHADLDRLKQEHEWMCAMYEQWRNVHTVSFVNVCDDFARR